MDGDDPWYWEVDRIVRELCTEQRSWTINTTSRRMPNPVALEKALREQEIDGSTLLTEVDEKVLEDRLGIKIFGQLAAVKQVIRDLRRISKRYLIWKDMYGSELSLASHIPQSFVSVLDIKKRSESPVLHTGTLEFQPYILSDRMHGNEIDSIDGFKGADIDLQTFPEDVSLLRGLPFTKTASNKRRRSDSAEGDSSTTLPVLQNNNDDGTQANEPRKKHKRIAPTLVSSHIDTTRDRAIPTQADMVIDNDPHNVKPGVIYIGDDGKKRMVPISQFGLDLELPRRHQEQLHRLVASETTAFNEGGSGGLKAAENLLAAAKKEDSVQSELLSVGYLGKNKYPVDDVFYKDTAIGKELSSTEDEDGNFMHITHGDISDGRRIYVHGLMKHFLRSQRRVTTRDGKQFSAILPYAARLIPMHQRPSFTLFNTTSNKEVCVTRQDYTKWPEFSPDASNNKIKSASIADDRFAHFDLPDNLMLGGPSSYDNWDPDLLQKYMYMDGGDTVLPLYGESDEEAEYDVDTWKQIEREQGTLEKPPLPLTRRPIKDDEINRALDKAVAQIMVKWNEEKLPRRHLQAWALWKKSKRDRDGRQRIREHRQFIKRVNNHRLPQMRREILNEIWTSQKQVHKQAKVLEESIFQREDAVWRISILKLKTEPDKPPRKTFKAIEAKRLSYTEEDGDSVISETAEQSSDEDLGSFIVSDESGNEGDHRPADDEAEDVTTSDAESASNDEGDNARLPNNHEADHFSRMNKIEENDENRQMVDIEDAHQEDDLSLFVGSQLSNSPSLPLRQGNADDIKLSAQKSAVQRESTTLQDVVPEVVDLTLLTSDASGAEGSSRPFQINGTSPNTKPKTGTEPSFMREMTPINNKASVIQISDSEDDERIKELPPYTDPQAIGSTNRKIWQRVGDRNRLLIGELYRMMPDPKKELFALFSLMDRTRIWSCLVEVMHAIRDGEDRVKDMDSKTYRSVTGVIRLFEMYADCKYRGPRPTLSALIVEKIEKCQVYFHMFHNICCRTLEELLGKSMVKSVKDKEGSETPPTSLRNSNTSSGASNSDIEETIHNTPHKVRKKKVLENEQARSQREKARKVLREEKERRRQTYNSISQSEQNLTEGRKRIIINDAKHDDQGFIYVDEEISKYIKPHQVEGIQFMWSQIVTNAEVMQGCLLAHTMGLGKTMQVITLLVAIEKSARSSDLSILSQIPPSLRVSKTLVLCPPGLVDNWMDELAKWAPKDVLGRYWKCASLLGKSNRLEIIEGWGNEGGILVIGYEMFRKLIDNKSTIKNGAPFDGTNHAEILEHLLEGPNIVVADEAHLIKNPGSQVTQAANRFRTKSRIALTGSPLANNVEEYHTMIEWIAPNYLGPIVEFRAKYVEPIQQGLWYDSTVFERRDSLIQLGVLKEDLAPKVHRADVSVLQHDLQPKREFVITVPLTDIQRDAYSIYVRSMVGRTNELTKGGQLVQTTLWTWLAILSLLCNHPECFMAKLTEDKKRLREDKADRSEYNASLAKLSIVEDDPVAVADPVYKVGISEELVQKEMELFSRYDSPIEAIGNSNKVKILLQILDASRAIGDKVLIFTQSIPTLNYLDSLCKNTHRKYARLDGSTQIKLRQDMTKSFNTNDTEILLISTRAGGLGLNLPGANRVIIFDFRYNPIHEEQAVGRAYRIGQKKPVFVYRLVAGGTFEEKIHNKAVFKLQLASRVVDKKNPVAWAKKGTREFLFEPKPVNQQDLSSFEGMDPHVLDKLLERQDQESTIRAIVMTDTFERHDDESLTPEDQKTVKQLVSDEELRRSNPKEYQAMLLRRNKAEAKLVDAQALRPQISSDQKFPPSVVTYSNVTAVENCFEGISGPASEVVGPIAQAPTIQAPTSVHKSPYFGTSNIQGNLTTSKPDLMPIVGGNTKVLEATLAGEVSVSQTVPKAFPTVQKPSLSRTDPRVTDPAQMPSLSRTDPRVTRPAQRPPFNFGKLNTSERQNHSSHPQGPRSDLSNRSSKERKDEVSSIFGARYSLKAPRVNFSSTDPQAISSLVPQHSRSLPWSHAQLDPAKILGVAIKKATRENMSPVRPKSKYSDETIEKAGNSIMEALRRNDPSKLKARSQEIAQHLIQDPKLVESLLSGYLTADDVATKTSIKVADLGARNISVSDKHVGIPDARSLNPENKKSLPVTNDGPDGSNLSTEWLSSSFLDKAPDVRRDVTHNIVSAFISTFRDKQPNMIYHEFRPSESLIQRTAEDLISALAVAAGNSKSFGIIVEAALKQLQDFKVCISLSNRDVRSEDFANMLAKNITKPETPKREESSGSTKHPHHHARYPVSLRISLDKQSKESRYNILRSPQAKADIAHLEQVAASQHSRNSEKNQDPPTVSSRSPPSMLPNWVLSEIHRANTPTPRPRPAPSTSSQSPTRHNSNTSASK